MGSNYNLQLTKLLSFLENRVFRSSKLLIA